MSVIIVIGGGPRPNATLYTLSPVSADVEAKTQYAIMDGNECLGVFERQSYAEAILPLIQRGE